MEHQSCFTWIGYFHWLLSQRAPFISAARLINRRATSIPNLWFSSCSATPKKKSLSALIFWLLHMDWLFPLAFKPTGPFHLCRSADKSPCDFDSEPVVLIVLRDAKKKEPFGSYFLAASHGFEPRLTESESAVLPLDDSAISRIE